MPASEPYAPQECQVIQDLLYGLDIRSSLYVSRTEARMHKRRQVCRELYRAKALEEQSVRQIRHIGERRRRPLLKLLTDRRGR
jgi:hypothetical protein